MWLRGLLSLISNYLTTPHFRPCQTGCQKLKNSRTTVLATLAKSISIFFPHLMTSRRAGSRHMVLIGSQDELLVSQ